MEKPTEADTTMFDMLLEAMRRQKSTRIEMKSFGVLSAFPFSSGAFTQLMTGNDSLKSLDVQNLRLADDVCDIIGGLPACLNSLQLSGC
jgi:hypothetical protein